VPNRWLLGARLRTLPAAIVPVAVGTATVSTPVIAWRAVAALVVAVAIQVGTNYANDYSDGIRGTDTVRSGPPRLVGSGLAAPAMVRRAALLSFAVAGVFGLALAIAVSPWLLVVGAVSFAAGWLYTGGPRPYGYIGLGEVFVFVFFGLVATVGSAYVQTSSISGVAVLAAVPVGLLAVALLVTNNLRDIPGDTQSGKTTLAVRLGDPLTRRLYVGCLAAAALCVPVIAAVGHAPFALVGLAAFALAAAPVSIVLRGAKGPGLIPVLVATGRVQLAFGALLSLGLIL